jgi:hypothetical protein
MRILLGPFGSLIGLCAGSACAQWSAVRLHPLGAYSSSATGVNATQQAGFWQPTSSALEDPVIWFGTSSFLNLAPAATDWGELYGMEGDTQYGIFGGGGVGARAAIWHGTPESRVVLDPTGAFFSAALGAHGSEQVGVRGSPAHAVLWHGTAGSLVDLHPPGALESAALGTDGLHQGGYVHFTAPHAALWSGTAASMIDMNPIGSAGSRISGMVPGQQVGYAAIGTPALNHASIWSGTAASWIDLNPPGSTSELDATCGSAQVGQLNGGSAAIWFGTPQSVINLHSFLPPSYFYSVATSVYESNGLFYVGGWAQQSSGTPQEAFLWVGVPAPSGLALLAAAGFSAGGRRRRIS